MDDNLTRALPGGSTSGSPEGAVGDAPTQPNDALPGGTRLGSFELKATLGAGGFGVVYQAWDHDLGQPRAIKEYLPNSVARRGNDGYSVQALRGQEAAFSDGLDRFLEEARVLARFDHPALVRVLQRIEANSTAYIVMPLYDGMTMLDYVSTLSHPPLESWLLSLLDALTAGLAQVHAANWLHRDIAPDNIMLLGSELRPVLLDFGAARQALADRKHGLTAILKPGYAPVEQYAETAEIRQGPWTDVYALAATVCWAICGEKPPPASTRAIAESHVPLVMRRLGSYSPAFLQALDHALSVDPRQRTANVGALRLELGLPPVPVQSVSAIPTSLERTVVVPPPRPTRRRLVATTWLTGLASLGAVSGWWLSSRPRSSTNNSDRSRSATATPAPASASVPLVEPSAKPAAPAPAASGPPMFDPLAQVTAVLAARTPGFEVYAEPISSRLSIQARHSLRFRVRSNRDGYLTVLLAGADGALMRLFADAALPALHLRAGQWLDLPPAGRLELRAAEPIGFERLLVIVSGGARDLSLLGRPSSGDIQPLDTKERAAAALESWREPYPILLGSPLDCAGGDCNEFGAAMFEFEVVR